MSPITVGIRDLRNHLSAYLHRVKAGESVVVTNRGKPVARIVPLKEEALRRLELAGVLTWSGRKLGPSKLVRPAVSGECAVSKLLLDDRERRSSSTSAT